MNKIMKVIFWIFLSFQLFSITFATWRYEYSLGEAIAPIKENLNTPQPNDPQWWGNTLINFLFNIIDDFVIPLAISAWILIGILWAYKVLFSSDEKEVWNWWKMLIFGVIWIIIMISAKYIWSVLFEDIFASWNLTWITGVELSQALYSKIAYPFIKIALYLALTVIFIILLAKSISLITKSDWSSQKKAVWMIWRSAVSILIIIWTKNIVEGIYWKQDDVFSAAENLWEIGTWILTDKNIPILYNVINRWMSIIALVIFILLLVQWFQILINPSKAENFQKLWKNILYTVIWLFVIWIWYLLTNALIIN